MPWEGRVCLPLTISRKFSQQKYGFRQLLGPPPPTLQAPDCQPAEGAGQLLPPDALLREGTAGVQVGPRMVFQSEFTSCGCELHVLTRRPIAARRRVVLVPHPAALAHRARNPYTQRVRAPHCYLQRGPVCAGDVPQHQHL